MAVLNHLTAHPHVPFTLSDLSLALGINAPSLSAVLQGLVEAGYVTRHPRRKTYALGPAGVALGHSAAHRFPEIEAAEEEMGRLVQHGDECIGSVRAGHEILIVSIEGRPSAKTRDAWIGQRIPMIPPFGQVFVSWASPDDIAHWLDQLNANGNTALRKRLLLSLERVRDEGFVVGLSNDPVSEVIELVNALTIADTDSARERLEAAIPRQGTSYVADGIDPDGEYDVANLVVPVFGPEGDVSFAITLSGIPRCSGTELRRIADDMLSAARRVTRAVGGKWAAPARLPGQGPNSAINAGADESARNGESP
jgi:DNA-binding IclR family transcriptional regulator